MNKPVCVWINLTHTDTHTQMPATAPNSSGPASIGRMWLFSALSAAEWCFWNHVLKSYFRLNIWMQPDLLMSSHLRWMSWHASTARDSCITMLSDAADNKEQATGVWGGCLCPNRLLMRSCDVSVCDFILQAREECFTHRLLLSSQSETGLPTVCIYRTECIPPTSMFSSLPVSDKPLHSPLPFPHSGSFLFILADVAASVSLSSALLSYMPCVCVCVCWPQSALFKWNACLYFSIEHGLTFTLPSYLLIKVFIIAVVCLARNYAALLFVHVRTHTHTQCPQTCCC